MSAADYYQQATTGTRRHTMPCVNSILKFDTSKEYTIGIICALSKEKAAAECFLDEEHQQTKVQPRGDNNAYTLGSIGPHNVVIASLPEGRYGTTNAATVARDMIRTFPEIRYGLMVGIGGGAPTAKDDIRLGDIVVAVPDSLRNEVLPYDFGKTVQDKKFHRVEGMNNCPLLLKNVVSALRTKYKRKGHPLQKYIENALKANERLRNEYQKPDPSADILYRSEYTHPERVDSCSQKCARKMENMMPRPIPYNLELEIMEEIQRKKEGKERKPKEKIKDKKPLKAPTLTVETPNRDECTMTSTPRKRMSSGGVKSARQGSLEGDFIPHQIHTASEVITPAPISKPTVSSSSFDQLMNGQQQESSHVIARDDPTIHYGPIASGNQLMKDAKLRDSLARENGILCFEMEASGLMEHFPSLVIRGICDYSDTHKNDQWQGYAAIAAAAYAKDVLCNLPIQKVKDEKPAQKMILETVENWPSVVPNGTERKLDHLLAFGLLSQDASQMACRSLHDDVNDNHPKAASKEASRRKDRSVADETVVKSSGTELKKRAQRISTSKHQANTKKSRFPKPPIQDQNLSRRASGQYYNAGIVPSSKYEPHSAHPTAARKILPKNHTVSRIQSHKAKPSYEKHSHPQLKRHGAHPSNKSQGLSSKYNYQVPRPPKTNTFGIITEPQSSGLDNLKDAIVQLNDVCKKRRSKKQARSSTSSSSEDSSSDEMSSEDNSEQEVPSDEESSDEELSADEAASRASPSESESSSEAETSESNEEDQSTDYEGSEGESDVGSGAKDYSGESSSDESGHEAPPYHYSKPKRNVLGLRQFVS